MGKEATVSIKVSLFRRAVYILPLFVGVLTMAKLKVD